MPVNIASTPTLRVDHYRAFGGDKVAITFTAWVEGGKSNFPGTGFGHYLTYHGYDVIAFKSDANDWYRTVDDSTLDRVRRAAAAYDFRVCAGSSMGGYAALRFSKILDAHTVVAFSPQYDISQPWDARWASDAKRLAFRDDMEFGGDRRYFIVYDPKDQDALHVAEYAKRIPVTPLKFPYSGHPTGFFLNELQSFRPLLVQTILSGAPNTAGIRKCRGLSPTYWYTIAKYNFQRKRSRRALWMLEKALALDPDRKDALELIKIISKSDYAPISPCPVSAA
jgi:hypothetical protein